MAAAAAKPHGETAALVRKLLRGGRKRFRRLLACARAPPDVDALGASSGKLRRCASPLLPPPPLPRLLGSQDCHVHFDSPGAASRDALSAFDDCEAASCISKSKSSFGQLHAPLLRTEASADNLKAAKRSASKVVKSVSFGCSIADSRNSSKLVTGWMNFLSDALVFLQCADTAFYRCDLQKSWLGVNEANLQVHRALFYRKFAGDLAKVGLMILLTPLTLPVRVLIGVPFWTYVIRHTRREDIVAKQARRMREVTLQLLLLVLACCVSGRIWLCAWGHHLGFSSRESQQQYMNELSSSNGSVTQAELFEPFKAVVMILVLEVIRKQRRDMAYQVNMMRHHLIVDEHATWEESTASVGPISQSDEAQPCWLLAPAAGSSGGPTRLQLHREYLEEQLHMLAVGTGAVSELTDNEQEIFYKSGMQDLLELRLEEVLKIEDLVEKMRREGVFVKTVPVTLSSLVEWCAAGYPKHFKAEKPIFGKEKPKSKYAIVIALLYALVPTLSMIWRGKLPERSPFVPAGVPEVAWLVPLSAFGSYIWLKSLLGLLFAAASDLTTAFEGFVILQRMASTHHHLHSNMKELESKADRKISVTATSPYIISRMLSNPTMHSDNIKLRETRNKVHFKASLMRGADCHVHVTHKHKFDRLVRKKYGAAAAPRGSHCQSFVELDLHDHGQLHMWWALRRYMEIGLLDHKVTTELVLVVTVVCSFVTVVFSLSEYYYAGHPIISDAMVVWELLFFGVGLLAVITACAQLNLILQSDSKRLTFIQHDLISDWAAKECQAKVQKASALIQDRASPEQTAPQPPCNQRCAYSRLEIAAGGAQLCRQAAAASGVGFDSGREGSNGMQEKTIAYQLMRIYIDHIDRDFHPLQLFGVTINKQFLSRAKALIFSGVSTAAVHLVARVVFQVDHENAPVQGS